MINKLKLEKLLLTNWTDFLNGKALMSLAEEIAINQLDVPPPCKVHTLTLSRFELVDNGFVIWVDFTANNGKVKITSELNLSNSEIKHIHSILN